MSPRRIVHAENVVTRLRGRGARRVGRPAGADPQRAEGPPGESRTAPPRGERRRRYFAPGVQPRETPTTSAEMSYVPRKVPSVTGTTVGPG